MCKHSPDWKGSVEKLFAIRFLSENFSDTFFYMICIADKGGEGKCVFAGIHLKVIEI